jgi:hypothetical protein
MGRKEIIQRSEVIFVGQVLEKNVRWNEKRNLIMTDYTMRVDELLKGAFGKESVVLSFAGGQLGEEIHQVSGIPELDVGEVSVLMIKDLNSPKMSPLTGTFQVRYVSAPVSAQRSSVAFNGGGGGGGGGEVELSGGKSVGFSSFVELVKTEIVSSRLASKMNRDPLPSSLPFILKDLPSVPDTGNQKRLGIRSSANLPESAPIDDALIPVAPEFVKPKPGSDETQPDGPSVRWAYSGRAKDVPIVFNPWPDTFSASLRSHDQFAMSYWNKYANIFSVLSNPTSSWAWDNGVNDMAGFPSNQSMINQFGEGWGDGTLAVCVSKLDSDGFRIESDIAVNPAFNWTTDDFTTFNDPNVFNLDNTLTHELGHAWGLEHQFEKLSIMNYAPKKYDAYNVIYLDDAAAVRSAFPNNATSLTDLGVALFDSVGTQNYDDSSLDKSVVAASDSLTVTDFVIENTGTVTVTPSINWYLTPSIHSFAGSYFVGSTSHSVLETNKRFLTSRTLSIPSGIPNGTYYLACSVGISNDSISENNSSWLDQVLLVDTPQPPANDDWFGLSVSNTASGTNVDATEEANEPDIGPAGATVWWYYIAPADGTVTINTFGSSFDTLLHVYSGVTSGFDSATLEAEDDDTNGLQSEVSFSVQAGTIYDIRVSGYNSESGQITLNTSFVNSSEKGDVDLDGVVGFLDISPFIAILSSQGFQAEADIDDNGAVDFLDITPFIALLSGQ